MTEDYLTRRNPSNGRDGRGHSCRRSTQKRYWGFRYTVWEECPLPDFDDVLRSMFHLEGQFLELVREQHTLPTTPDSFQ